MADLLFVKRPDGEIMKLEGDHMIRNFVGVSREAFQHIETVEVIYRRVSLIEHDLRVKDRIMARLFLVPNFIRVFDWLTTTTNEDFKLVIDDFKECLSYKLFPVPNEFERAMEGRFGFGVALKRKLGQVPKNTFSYFN